MSNAVTHRHDYAVYVQYFLAMELQMAEDILAGFSWGLVWKMPNDAVDFVRGEGFHTVRNTFSYRWAILWRQD